MSELRFLIGGRTLEDSEIYSPLNTDQISFEWQKQDGELYKRHYLKGELVFKDHDFIRLANKLKKGNLCKEYTILVQYKCIDGWRDFWLGVFPIGGGKWDFFECTFRIEPKPYDVYKCILDKAKDEYNVFALENVATAEIAHSSYTLECIIMSRTLWSYEYFTGFCPHVFDINPLVSGMGDGTGSDGNPDPNLVAGNPTTMHLNGYQFMRNRMNFIRRQEPIPGQYYGEYNVETTWCREYSLVPVIEGASSPPSGSGWQFESDITVGGVKFHKYVRQPAGGTLYTLSDYTGTFNSCSYELSWNNLAGTTYSLTNGRYLKNVLNFYGSLCQYPEINNGQVTWKKLTVKSNFFGLNYDSQKVADSYELEETFEQRSNIKLFHASDVANVLTTQNASQAVLTFEAVNKWLQCMFQVFYIVENGVLRFEHISYWDERQTVTIDLTEGKHAEKTEDKKEVTFDTETGARRENFKMDYAVGLDFIGVPIEYKNTDGEFKVCVGDDEKDCSTPGVSTDILFAVQNSADVDSLGDSWFMVVTDDDNNVASYVGYLSLNASLLNGLLSIATLQELLHRHHKETCSAAINLRNVSLNGCKRTAKQEELISVYCPCEDGILNPLGLAITYLGDGLIDEIKWQPVTKQITFNLLYDGMRINI